MAKTPDTESTESQKEGQRKATVNWNDSEMKSNFANVVNIQGTKDQVDLFFGTNQTWDLAKKSQVTVDLSNRIILTPLVAKRLYQSLGQLLEEHERRHGELQV